MAQRCERDDIEPPLRGARLKNLVYNLMHRSDRRRICRRCGSERFEREPRFTVVQLHIMPFFGLYPWRCLICGQGILRTLRANSEDEGGWR